MKIFAKTTENEFEFEWLDQNGDGPLLQKGKNLELQWTALGNGRYSLVRNGKSYIINLSKKDDGYQVRVSGFQFMVNVEDERTRKLNELVKASGSAHGEQSIKAPIPGLVVKVYVRPGDKIENGHPLLILEAMKMENLIKAPFTCEVLEVAVKEKETVNQGHLLLKLKGI